MSLGFPFHCVFLHTFKNSWDCLNPRYLAEIFGFSLIKNQIWKHWKFYLLNPLRALIQRRRWDFEFCNRYCIFLSLFSFLNLQIPWKKDLKSSRIVAFKKFSFKTWKCLPMHFLDRKWFHGPILSNIVLWRSHW